MRRTIFNLVLGVAFGLLLVASQAAVGQSADISAFQERLYEVIDRSSPAVVRVQRRGAVFSGVIVSPQGHVLTAGHTVTPGERYTVQLQDGRRLVGLALGACEQMRGDRIDCGLILISEAQDLPFVPLGSSSRLAAEQPCLSISFPGGQLAGRESLVRLGFVQRATRSGRFLESTALMEPGDSGGPLLDMAGSVIGIHSRIGARMQHNFDMPVDGFKTYWDALNVACEFSAYRGRALPKLGFTGQDSDNGDGIAILTVVEGGIAHQLGLQPSDVLTRIQDRELSGMRDLQSQLLTAIEAQAEQLALSIRRGQEEVQYLLPTDRLAQPVAERIDGLDDLSDSLDSTAVEWRDAAAILESYRASLSERLSSTCVLLSSNVGESTKQALATRIAASKYLVAKSSIVGDWPCIAADDQQTVLEIVARDFDHDLVLLKCSTENADGIPLELDEGQSALASSPIRRGLLLFSPHPSEEGLISIVGSSAFASRRDESRGFLGVVLNDRADGGVVLAEVDEGAAQRAGLQIGDVITKLDQTAIRNRTDMMQLLHTKDPYTRVVATFQRGPQQMETAIILGTRPSSSNHAADMMQKSLRRDGFPSVFSHDATLTPELCGGPVFDLHGQWAGLNIARNSRVRTFAIPSEVVAEFIRQNREE